MATSFTRQATNQVAPAYNQKAKALKSKVPFINKAFSALSEGLDMESQAQSQLNLEDASGRGLLKSSIPVEGQQAIQQALIGQKGELANQQGQQLSEVNLGLADLGIQKSSAISVLINALRDRALRQQSLSQERALADRQYQLDRDMVNRGYY